MSKGRTDEARTIEPGVLLAERYLVEDRLGTGGMGTVWRGRQLELDREVAIKVIGSTRPEESGQGAAGPLASAQSSSEQVARFEREAKLLARLSHPNIVTVHDFGRTSSGALFLVLELVRGEDLGQRLVRDGPLPWPEVVDVGRQVAEALAYAHGEGVLHRDLKPSNVMLLAASRSQLKVIDFGLARLTGPGGEAPGSTPEAVTKSEYVVGTPGFIAPEYAIRGTVAPSVDHYALGMLLFQALYGTHLFQSSDPLSPPEAAAQRLAALRPPPPRELIELIVGLVEPSPQNRPQDPLAVLQQPMTAPSREATTAEAKRKPLERRAPRVHAGAKGRPEVDVDGALVPLLLPTGNVTEVRVPSFRIDKHLVTQGDYAAFVADGRAPPPESWGGPRPSRAHRALPVVDVSFEHAKAFARWLGRRLPTEAEWELAARGPSSLDYPWGDRFERGLCHPVYEVPLAERIPGPIGVFSPQGDSPFGLADLLQLWEWVAAPYQTVGALVRGGVWRDRQQPAVLSNRSWEDEPALDVGFRTAALG